MNWRAGSALTNGSSGFRTSDGIEWPGGTFRAAAFEGLQQAFAPELDDAWHRYRRRVDDEADG